MMSFLAYMTGFFMNFELFPILTDYEAHHYAYTVQIWGTFWLKIEQFWPFEEISIFSNGSHFGYRTAVTDTILKGDHLRIISAKLK
jgi:hypothetical protein